MFNNFLKYVLRKPDDDYLEWLLPQNKNALFRGVVFTLITVTALSYVDNYYYAEVFYRTLENPPERHFGWDNFFRLVVVPLLNIGAIFLASSNRVKSMRRLEKIAGTVLFLSVVGLLSSALAQLHYTSDDYTYEVLVIILFTQFLYGLTFRTSFIFSSIMVLSVLIYVTMDTKVEAELAIYDAVMIVLVWVSVLVGSYNLEKAMQSNYSTIVKLEDAQQDLLNNANELKSKNHDLEQFAYASSHDLQEPLRTISNFVTILERQLSEKMTEDQRLYMGLVLNSTERMKNLIFAILEYSRIGRTRTLETIDCGQLLNDVLADLNYAIQESNSTVQLGQLPVVNGYRAELATLFQNLISNALKFRKIDVKPIVLVDSKSDGDEIIFSVVDNGIGIDTKYADKVFQLFSRLHNKDEYKGTGIGLTHSKKIVEMHGGKIWLESCEGQGTAFHFSISKTLNNTSNE